ncbi:hypothetical protein MNBD_BACTEROID03-632 [hydrothermal vent metagenome]|uniref:Uncharacterized protein n=1 Tax=hydrothermal vent metagenome TaxID=652676 RepID=A0A3B0T8D0_9ZZZZ
MKTSLVFSTVLLLFTIGCKPQQYTTENLPEKQLVFGNGGGITGALDTYILLKNGQFFRKSSLTKEIKELKNIGKKEAEVFFEKMGALELSKIEFDRQRDYTQFIGR